MAVAQTILVVAETRGGVVTPLTREVLGLACDLAARENHPHPNLPPEGEGEPPLPLRGRVRVGVVALLIAESSDVAGDLLAHGADRVYFCQQPTEEYEGEVWVAIAEHLAREIAPSAIFASHTPAGADLAPRLASRLESAVATGCVSVTAEAGKLLFTRPCYGGNVRETLSFGAAPAIATVMAGVGTASEQPSRQGEIVRVELPALKRRTRVIARVHEAADAESLEDAKIIVAGGRGLEGPEGFRVLEELADVLGAVVGASRVPCDLGWCPHSRQIGLTGKTVTPDLYFAVGISGAGHHMAGCGNAKTIVAINTDPQAAIFRDARFEVVGDYRKIVPALIDALNRD